MDPSDSRRLYTAGYKVWRSNDRGDNWSIISPPLSSGFPMWSMAVAPGDPNTLYTGATGNGVLYRTSNALAAGGASWTDITSPALPDRLINAIAVDPLNSDIAYLGVSGFSFGADTQGHVFKTTDGGTTWADISANLPNTPVNAVLIDPSLLDTIYVGTDVGVFRTKNGGRSWQTLVQGLPRVTVTDLALNRDTRTLRASTFGRGMWDLQLPF